MKKFEENYLNSIKNNIISWYNFSENANICIIGNNVEEYVKFLKSKGKNVCSNLNNQLFDYIIVFEELETLEIIKNNLKPNGIIILILNNKLGIENFVTITSENNLINNLMQKYTKYEIEEKLQEYGYKDYKFYYPLPNYNTANVIFSDDYLPDYNNFKLINNYYYPKDTKLLYREAPILRELTRKGKFKEYTNSYFIEINNDSKELFVGFNNTRKDEYRLCTKVYKEYVEKESIFENENHIKNLNNNIKILKDYNIKTLDEFKENKIYSKFTNAKTLNEIIIDYIVNSNIDKALEVIINYYTFLKEKFKNNKTEKINKTFFENVEDLNELYIIKDGLIDLVFENVFEINEEYFVFDQEWKLENIPLEFVLYRAINNMYIYNYSQIEKYITIEEMYKKFNLEKYIEIFKIAESKFQEMVVDKEKINLYESKELTNVNKLESEIEQSKFLIQNLNKESNDKQLTINYYENMRIIKFIKKLKNK